MDKIKITDTIFVEEHYNHGWLIEVVETKKDEEGKEYEETLYSFSCPLEKVDAPRIFKISNVYKFYKWRFFQKAFWFFGARGTPPLELLLKKDKERKMRDFWKYWVCQKIADLIRTHIKLNDPPFWG